MHKMSTKMHINSQIKVPKDSVIDVKKRSYNSDINNENGLPEKSELDIEKENRLSKIISLYSRGYSQDEIATKLGVNQSTVSRDLQFIKQQARSQIDKYLRKDILFEYTKYLTGSNEVIRELWGIIESNYNEPKDKVNALKLLLQAYQKGYQRLVDAPDSYLNIKRTENDLEYEHFIESDSTRKAMDRMQGLDLNGNILAPKILNRKMK